MRHGSAAITTIAAAAFLAGGLLAGVPPAPAAHGQVPTLAPSPQAQVSPTPDASLDQQRIADLQAQVAALATQVAQLGGGDQEALAARLGGSRVGFDAALGLPAAYPAPGEVAWDVPEIGRVTVTFENGRATKIVAVAPRDAARALAEPDPADWTPARAAEVLARFAPADADAAALQAADVTAPGQLSASSAALQSARAAADPASCGPAGPRAFTASYTAGSPDHVAAVELALGPEDAAAVPPTPERAGRSSRGAKAVANSSMGGVVSVNGLRMQAVDVDENVLPGGGASLAVEIAIDNQTRRPVTFQPTDFVLVDAEGYEITASCAGPEPILAQAEIGRNESVEGWITFAIPEGFVPQKVVVLAADARVGFALR